MPTELSAGNQDGYGLTAEALVKNCISIQLLDDAAGPCWLLNPKQRVFNEQLMKKGIFSNELFGLTGTSGIECS